MEEDEEEGDEKWMGRRRKWRRRIKSKNYKNNTNSNIEKHTILRIELVL